MTKNELLSAYNKVLAENVELKKELDWYKNYADRLVKHKDMVCLPADLKNLRESNLKLAIYRPLYFPFTTHLYFWFNFSATPKILAGIAKYIKT